MSPLQKPMLGEVEKLAERVANMERGQTDLRGVVHDLSMNVSTMTSTLTTAMNNLVVAVSGKTELSAQAEVLVESAAATIGTRKSIVLVVDDDAHMRKAYARIFSKRCELHMTDSIANARPYIEAFGLRLDLLILDVGLPDGNGLQILKELRAMSGGGALVPVAVVSAYGNDIEREALRISGRNSVCWVIDKTEASERLRDMLNNGGFGRHDRRSDVGVGDVTDADDKPSGG